MNVEFVGAPVMQTSGNFTAEKVKMLVTRDDGTTAIGEERSIVLQLGDLTIEAGLAIVEGETHLGLITLRKVSVSEAGEVSKVANSAFQTAQGDLHAVENESFIGTPREYETMEQLADIIKQVLIEHSVPTVAGTASP